MIVCANCDVVVHPECYGAIKTTGKTHRGEKKWICDLCYRNRSSKKDSEPVFCAICKTSGGAMKACGKNQWAHIVCVLAFSDLSFGDPLQRRRIKGLGKSFKQRRREGRCMFCEKSKVKCDGAVLQCAFEGCAKQFHPPCAHAAGVKLFLSPRVQDKTCAQQYCLKHQRIVRNSSKNRQAKRKTTTTTTTTTTTKKKKKKKSLQQSLRAESVRSIELQNSRKTSSSNVPSPSRGRSVARSRRSRRECFAVQMWRFLDAACPASRDELRRHVGDVCPLNPSQAIIRTMISESKKRANNVEQKHRIVDDDDDESTAIFSKYEERMFALKIAEVTGTTTKEVRTLLDRVKDARKCGLCDERKGDTAFQLPTGMTERRLALESAADVVVPLSEHFLDRMNVEICANDDDDERTKRAKRFRKRKMTTTTTTIDRLTASKKRRRVLRDCLLAASAARKRQMHARPVHAMCLQTNVRIQLPSPVLANLSPSVKAALMSCTIPVMTLGESSDPSSPRITVLRSMRSVGICGDDICDRPKPPFLSLSDVKEEGKVSEICEKKTDSTNDPPLDIFRVTKGAMEMWRQEETNPVCTELWRLQRQLRIQNEQNQRLRDILASRVRRCKQSFETDAKKKKALSSTLLPMTVDAFAAELVRRYKLIHGKRVAKRVAAAQEKQRLKRESRERIMCTSPGRRHRRRGRVTKESDRRVSSSGEELFCVCKKPYDEEQFYLMCDFCEDWFHGDCVGVQMEDAPYIEKFACVSCIMKGKGETSFKMYAHEAEGGEKKQK
eukprot:g212.t1